MTSEPETAVGHGKPPVHSRFKKGQSGNPKGRPRKVPTSLDREFNEALKEALHMRYERLGTSTASSCLNKVAQKLVLKAADGDARSIQYLLKRTEICDAADVAAETDAAQQLIGSEPAQTEEITGKGTGSVSGSETGSGAGSETGNGSGSVTGNDAVPSAPDAAEPVTVQQETPAVPPRPKRPQIIVAGRIVQDFE